MTKSFDFASVDHLTFGALGEPGHRLFLFQAASGAQLATLKLEKQQVTALCSYLAELLADLPSPAHPPEDHELREPLDVAWVVGSMGVSYDDVIDRMIIELEQLEGIDDTDLLSEASSLRVAATREQAASLIIHGTTLVEAGRPPCPLCGYPLDPAGHACPRTNGHRPPSL